jgi:hypothetical protein
MHLKERLSINLVVLVVILLLDGEKFLVREEDVFVPVLGVPLKEKLCCSPSNLLQSRSKVSLRAEVRCHVYIVPEEARLDWVDMLCFRNIIFCFQSGFRRIRSRTLSIATSALTNFRCPDGALSSTLLSSL